MNKTVPKHRKKLNDQQLEVLGLLYKFRFGSNDLFAEYFGKKDRSFVYKRLTILQEQGLIGKRFDSTYRLQGKPAAYYLTPEGARRLQEARGMEVNIKAIYKDRGVSEQFVSYSLELFAIHNRLKAQYGESLKFFTKTNLSHEDYDYFPKPLPDAYIRLGDRQFFLDIYHDDQPYFVAVRKIKQYIAYDENADWSVTETDLPMILAVCESSGLVKRVQKRMVKALDGEWSDSEVVFGVTTKSELLSGEPKAWQRADKPDEMLALQDI